MGFSGNQSHHCFHFFLKYMKDRAISLSMLAQPTEPVESPEKVARLSELEIEAIEMFINFLKLIGLPKSVGEIYGLLFVSPKPLAMDDLMQRLQISGGAASQGLRLLRSFGAVKVSYVPGDRRDHYMADLDLSNFATVFIKDELQPRMDRALDRIARMDDLSETLSAADRKVTLARIERLKHWMEKGQKMLPWILKFLVR
jgi:DNA-binding transcriptional regulator GbsR (MarR family)